MKKPKLSAIAKALYWTYQRESKRDHPTRGKKKRMTAKVKINHLPNTSKLPLL